MVISSQQTVSFKSLTRFFSEEPSKIVPKKINNIFAILILVNRLKISIQNELRSKRHTYACLTFMFELRNKRHTYVRL